MLFFVATFVLPIILTTVSLVAWHQFAHIQPWLDFTVPQSQLLLNEMSGKAWGQLFTTTLIWVIVPVSLGLFRITRAEVK